MNTRIRTEQIKNKQAYNINNNNNNKHEVKALQKTATLGTAHILWKGLT